MKKFTLILFITLVSFLSFSQKNVNLFATDFHSFSMTVDELTYFMNTDTTLNKWSYVESYDSDAVQTPDLKGRFVIGAGPVENTSNSNKSFGENSYDKSYNYNLGETGGEFRHTLTIDEMPVHNHALRLDNACFKNGGCDNRKSINPKYDLSRIDEDKTGSTGGSMPHNNIPPYYALIYIMKI
jgi:microcystin-dependent protein